MDSMKDETMSYYEQREAFNAHPIIQKRGKLFRNWWNYESILGIVRILDCPICGSPSDNLIWKCHNHEIPFEKAVDLARKTYEEALHDEEDNKTLDKFKEEIGW